MPGWFKAGGFLFPTSTGNYEVVGDLPGTPQGVVFFGGNQAAIDTLLTPSAPGLFFGLAWTPVGGGIDYQSQAQTTYGVRWASRPITSLSTGTTVEYQADTMTFDATGFTIHVNVAAPAARLVHWLAWGDFDSAEGASKGGTSIGSVFDIPALGYRPLSALALSMFSGGASRNGSANGYVYLSLGSACFPTENTDALNDNAQAITFRSTGTTSQGWTQRYHRQLDTGITASVTGFVAGTYQTNIDHLAPHPTFTDEALRLTTFGSPNRESLAWWACEAFIDSVTAPAVAATAAHTAPAYIGEIDAALFYGTLGYGSEEQLGVNVAFMIGVLTPDYQGVVAFDTGRGNAPADGTKAFYQSQAACLVNALNPGGGVRVASGEIVQNQVVLTGEIASNSQHGTDFMHAWGHSQPNWMPQSYRFLRDWYRPPKKPVA